MISSPGTTMIFTTVTSFRTINYPIKNLNECSNIFIKWIDWTHIKRVHFVCVILRPEKGEPKRFQNFFTLHFSSSLTSFFLTLLLQVLTGFFFFSGVFYDFLPYREQMESLHLNIHLRGCTLRYTFRTNTLLKWLYL